MEGITGLTWTLWFLDVVGLLLAVGVWLIGRQARPEDARVALLGDGNPRSVTGEPPEVGTIATMAGGPVRNLDARVVDLVERGMLLVESGRFAPAPGYESLGGRVLTPEEGAAREALPRPSFDDTRLLLLTEMVGDGGIRALRAAAPGRVDHGQFMVTRRGFWVDSTTIEFRSMLLWIPTLAVLAIVMFWGIENAEFGLEQPARRINELTLSLSWAAIPVAQILIWNLKPGFHGRSAMSRLGRDVLAELRRREGPGTPQAWLVATGGISHMTDTALRQQVFGETTDVPWSARRWRRSGYTTSSDALSSPLAG